MEKITDACLLDQRGATLIELLMTMAISVMITSVLILAMYQLVNTARLQQEHMSGTQQIQSAMTMLNRDLTTASSGSVSDGGTRITLLVPSYVFGNAASVVTNTITYQFADGSNLVRSTDALTVTVARGLADVTFGADGLITETVYVSMLANAPAGSGQQG